MECRFKVGDRLKRVRGGVHNGMRVGNIGVVTKIDEGMLANEFELKFKDYEGLYSSFNYELVKPKRSHFPAWF